MHSLLSNSSCKHSHLDQLASHLSPPPPPPVLLSSMDCISHSSAEHLCYVRCNFCNTLLAVGVPCRRSLDTVTVKCGYCSCLSCINTRPLLLQGGIHHQSSLDHHHQYPQITTTTTGFQGFKDFLKGQASSPTSSSSTSSLQQPSIAPYVVKPPERKHRLPSAYNRFMKEEIQRIKAANPNIPHREAFGTAAKNWARYTPHSPSGWLSDQSSLTTERSNGCGMIMRNAVADSSATIN